VISTTPVTKMTTLTLLDDLLPIALDMTSSLTSRDRAQRLINVVAKALPCDAAVLLRLDGADLVPVAAVGVAPDLLGRRFRRSDHPRLDIICGADGPTVFPADSTLPDPYDGLIGATPESDVHSCLGCPLLVEGELVGVLTVDALDSGAFVDVDSRFLNYLAALAAAALRTSDLIEALEQAAMRRGLVVRDLVRDALNHEGGILIGQSRAMTRLRDEIELVARSQFPVVVTGETGVGKELVVRMLHDRSPRSAEPLVYVNCAALPQSVAESELFGHCKGAFTGATSERLGKFRVADGASLFLDEIGELPLDVQPKLLRVLQEGEIQAVGNDRPLHVDVRVFAATNRDLEAEVRAGRFRADLFHRLNVCRIEVPPLREHPEDIHELAGHFADRARQRLGTAAIRIAPDALAALSRDPWQGNIRELENVLYRAVLRASGRATDGRPLVIRAEDLDSRDAAATGNTAAPIPQAEASTARNGRTLREAVNAYRGSLIADALKTANGSWAEAARSLGMNRSNLYNMAKRYGLTDS
jgi:anaerobic nitric oxide reductase transcription regulator